MSPQSAGDGLESIVEFQVQIKGHNQREYEDRWQGWQNWTDEKLATKLTKDDQQPALLLPARWWPDTLPEFESGAWWQRTHTRVKCRQCKCSLVENPSFRSSKCQKWGKKQMKTKGKRLDGIVFTNADPRYARKLDDLQGGDTTMLMQQVREVTTVNQEMTDKSNCIWLTSEQMGFPLRPEFANENHGEAGSSRQCNDQRTDQTAFFLAPIIAVFIRNTKRKLYDQKLEDALELLDLEWSRDDDTKTQCDRLNTSPIH